MLTWSGCKWVWSFEMDETDLTFAKSGFAPFSFPKPAEEQVPHSAWAASLGVCPELVVLPLLFLFTKTKTCPEEFKPAAFALLINTNCKPVCLDLSVGRKDGIWTGNRWWGATSDGYLWLWRWGRTVGSVTQAHFWKQRRKGILKINPKQKMAAKKDLGKSTSCRELCTHMG